MRKFHILSSVALAFSLFFTLGSAATQAQDGSEFAGGNGTDKNPWQIATKQQLAAIDNYDGDASNGKYFILTKDLVFTAEDFSAIGDFYNGGALWKSLCSTSFLGNFDGNEHSISGLRFSGRDGYNSGLFGIIDKATIKNLTLIYTEKIETEGIWGGISATCSSSVIDNCHVIADFETSMEYFFAWNQGGLIGYDYSLHNNPTYIINSSFRGSIKSNGYAGGLVGYADIEGGETIVVVDSVVEADLSGEYVGGIIGKGGKGSVSVQNCHVKGSVEGYFAGGLMGTLSEEIVAHISIKESSFEGNVTGTLVGGFISRIEQFTDTYYDAPSITIESSYMSGKVIGKTAAGGFIGEGGVRFYEGGFIGCISKSYTEGEIKIDNGILDDYVKYSGNCAGGMIGHWCGVAKNEFVITDCYSHCDVTVNSSNPVCVGGLIGGGYNYIIQKSYAMGEIKGDQAVQASISGNHAYVGGLAGYHQTIRKDGVALNTFVSIQKSVAMNPSLIAPHGDKEDTGRIIGITDDKCNLDNNYALDAMMLKISNKDVTVTGTASDKNGLAKSASVLAKKSTYTDLDWDFDEVWKMSVNGYPIFIWQEDTPIATAPIITGQPVSQTVNAGSAVTFSVTATGTEPLSYQWYKDSTAISGATGSSYTINSVTTGDAGSYYVIVSNSIGSATSSVATLTVNAPASAPVIVTQPVSQTVDVGQNVRFSVVATGTEPLNYQWLKNGATIPGATSASYTISSAKMEDAGNYMVIVSNSVGMAVSNPVTLTVKDPAIPPVITIQPKSQEVLVGNSVTFSVVATGTEPLSYQWLFNGNPIAGATSSTYSISQVTEANEGNYSVIVSNVAGTAISSTAVLTVKILPPVIVMHPQTQIIMRGSTATFAVIAEGSGLSYQWTFNGKDIAGANQSVYMIPAAEAGNVGSYAVKVSNKAGSVTSQSAALWLNNLQMYAGVEVYGPEGAKFTVWYKDDAESGEWKKLTTSTVSGSPTVVIDYDSPKNTKRFYKVEIE